VIPETFHIRAFKRIALYGGGLIGILLLSTMIYVTLQFDGSAEFPAECGLVFGAAVHRGNVAGPGIQRRVGTAADLYHEGKLDRVILSGGKGSTQQDSEAVVMRRYAMLRGIDPSKIIVEGESRSTLENLKNVKELTANCNGVVGISDRYHLARIEYLAGRVGMSELMTHPADVHAPWIFEVKSSAREALGILYYWSKREL